MKSCTLEVVFTAEDLKEIYESKRNVVIMRHTPQCRSNVAWISFMPFEINEIHWEERFCVYVSQSEVSPGAKIEKLDCMEVAFQSGCVFKDWRFHSNDTCSIPNKMDDYSKFTFGLAQSITVNGCRFDKMPLNAVSVEYNKKFTSFAPGQIEVFLSEQPIESSTILRMIREPLMALDYTSTDKIIIMYDANRGMFFEHKQ